MATAPDGSTIATGAISAGKAMSGAMLKSMGVPFARIFRSPPVPSWSVKEEMMATMLREFNVRAVQVPLESVRASMASRPIPAGVKWTPIEAATVKGVWFGDYAPTEPDLTCILYLHGGGHIYGHAGQIGPFAKVVLDHARAQGRKLAIFSVDYRLAPEHPYPADLEDAVAAYTHAVTELHIRPDRLVVAGESSGGLLAVALVLRLRNERAALNLDLPAALALLSAKVNQHVDPASVPESCRRFDGIDTICPALSNYGTKAYLGSAPLDQYNCPITASLEGLPPAYIHIGEVEFGLDDNKAFAAKYAAEAGADKCTLVVEPGGFHGMIQLAAVLPYRALPAAKRWTDFVLNAVGTNPPASA